MRVFHEGKQHANPGRLVAAHRKVAEVHVDGHKKTELVPWDTIHDWVSENGGPGPMPEENPFKRKRGPTTGVAMTELTAMEDRAMKTEATRAETNEQVIAIREKLDTARVVSLGDVSARLDAAIAAVVSAETEIVNARAMLDEAVRAKAEKIAELADLRKSVEAILVRIDSVSR